MFFLFDRLINDLAQKGGEAVGRKKKEIISEDVLCAEYEAVYRYALVLCRNDADAQDITQETFLKAVNAAGQFQGDSSLYTWLCVIAKNIWLDRLKKRNREVPLDENTAVSDSGLSVEQRAEDRDVSLAIHRVLQCMAEPYKEVFSLRVFGQLPFAEIASLFGKTENWARVTYHRARRTITETLRKEGMV